MTIIDTVTNLVELIRIDSKEAEHVRAKFEQAWLSRYPWPKKIIHDPGGEFIAGVFKKLLKTIQCKDAEGCAKNAQSNAICERMHQTVGNVLRTTLHSNPPKDMDNARDIIDDALATAMHAMRCNVTTALGSLPGALVFGRDMFLNVPLTADWVTISKHREQLVNENLRKANLKRRAYDYAVGDKVLKKVWKPTKLGERTSGPYTIKRVHINGNVTVELDEDVYERINVRRIIPYRV